MNFEQNILLKYSKDYSIYFYSSTKWKGNFKRSMILIVLGFLKYCSTKLVDYHTHVSEYGIHWNFFFTMGIVQLVCGTITCFMTRKSITVFSIFIGLLHEFLLHKYHYQWIFNFTAKQRFNSNILLANAEGLISLLGFSSLYFFGSIICIKDLRRHKDALIKSGKILLNMSHF